MRPYNSGVGNYARELFCHMAKADKTDMDLTLALPEDLSEDSFTGLPVQIQRCTRWRKYLPFRENKWSEAFDLYHEPNFIPALFAGKTVVTVHDLSYRLFPECQSRRRGWMLRLFEDRLRRADLILTVSESSRKDIVRGLGIDPARVLVTYLGADAAFRPYTVLPEERAALEKLAIPEDYLLYVGNIEPRKNLLRLLDAYAAFCQRNGKGLKLVLAGGSGWKNKAIYQRVEDTGMEKQVICTGFFPQNLLPALYNRARALVYPSLYEGFGLPVLEAMACQLPVLAAATSSLPEVGGDAVHWFSPDDTMGMTKAMEEVLSSESTMQRMKEKGLRQAEKFSWERCARETIAAYRSLL